MTDVLWLKQKELQSCLSITDNKNLTTLGLKCERAAKITYSLSPAI
jgi:hypothetical protein